MPIHVAPATAYLAITVGMGAALVGLLVWWARAREYDRTGLVMPLLFLGVAIGSLIQEPVFDNVALYWYPPHNGWALYEAFGRTIPAYIPIGYAGFFGGVSFVEYRLIARGGTARTVWRLFAVSLVIDALATAFVSWINAGGFYGDQPFNVAQYPLWFAFVDAPTTIVNAIALLLLVPVLKGRRRLFLVLLPIITYSAVNGAVDPPAALALHSGWSSAATWVLAACSIAIGCAIVYACSLVAPAAARWHAARAVPTTSEQLSGASLAPPSIPVGTAPV